MTRRTPIEVGEYYHIYSRGVDKRQIFMDKSDYDRFVCLLYVAQGEKSPSVSDLYREFYAGLACSAGEACVKNWIVSQNTTGERIVQIGAWCLMPNHFHLLLKESTEGGISQFLLKVLTGYSTYFNNKHDRSGSLFDGPFRAEHLNSDVYLRHIYSYIHLNPVSIVDMGWKEKHIRNPQKAEEFLKNYHFSSYLDYVGVNRIEGKLLNKEVFPHYFDNFGSMDCLIREWLNLSQES